MSRYTDRILSDDVRPTGEAQSKAKLKFTFLNMRSPIRGTIRAHNYNAEVSSKLIKLLFPIPVK